MKKLFVCLCAGLLLVGCSGGSETASGEVSTKTCSASVAGIDMDMTLSGANDKGDKLVIAGNIPYETFASMGVDFTKMDVDELSDEMKDAMEKGALVGMGIDEDAEGVKVSFDFTDTALKMNIDIDLNAASDDTLSTLQMTDVKGMSMDDFATSMEAGGATCK